MAQQAVPLGDMGAVAAEAPAVSQPSVAQPEWQAIERDPEFQELVRAKRSFLLPATIFFIAFYFALPISVGYFPDIMDTKVMGYINVAYLFAILEFVMAWVLMGMYVQRAGVYDRSAGWWRT